MADANDPPSLEELQGQLQSTELALTSLLELLVTAPNALAVMIDQGALIAHTAEARRDVRTAMQRLADDA